jgi:hypothetical protein
MVSVGVAILSLLAAAQSEPVPPPPQFRMGPDTETPVPSIPDKFRSIIKGATREVLTVRALDGRDIPVHISGYRLYDYRLFQNDRFLGLEWSGYVVVGYLVIDRAARENAIIATGRQPLFSNDGHWFAVAGLTDASQGNFEAIGLWEVGPLGSTRRFYTDAVPISTDWRIERWVGNCVAFSALNSMPNWGRQAGSDEADAPAEPQKRDNYSLWIRPNITLHWSEEPPCTASIRP